MRRLADVYSERERADYPENCVDNGLKNVRNEIVERLSRDAVDQHAGAEQVQNAEAYRHTHKRRHNGHYHRDAEADRAALEIRARKTARNAREKYKRAGENVVQKVKNRICEEPPRCAREGAEIVEKVVDDH